jgi:uncharacterized Tic20 family protein
MNGDAPVAANQDSRNIAMLVWIGTIFFLFLPSLIVYVMRKDDAFIADQSKEALNWAITVAIGYCIGWVLTLILIGALIMWLVGLCNVVFCIMGAVTCSSGKAFRAPFALRLLK